MAINLQNIPGVRPIAPEVARRFVSVPERKGLLRRAGEFFAPTATGLLTGEKELGLRTGLGAALEVGAFAVPPARIAGLGARFLPRIFARKAAQVAAAKAAPGVVGLTQRFGRGVRGLGMGARRAALTGGVSGAMLGAGRALGREEAELKEVLGEAAEFGIAGGVGGAVLAPALTLTGKITTGSVKWLSRSIKNIYNTVNPRSRQLAVQSLDDAYYSSFVADKTAVMKKMEDIYGMNIRQGTRELAENGYIPIIEGQTARMKPIIDSLKKTTGEVADVLDKFLGTFKTKTSMTQLHRTAASKLRGRTDVDLVKSTRDLERFIKALKTKYGAKVDALTLRKIEIEAGKRSRAFKKGDKFVQDAANSVSQSTDEILQGIGGSQYKAFKTELQSLIRMRQTAEIINNQKAEVGFLTEAMGRFLGTVGGAAGGLQVAGPGGLVIAGVLANMGSKSAAQLIRLSRFNPQFQRVITQGLRHSSKVLQKLIKEATPEDAKVIKAFVGQTGRVLKTQLPKVETTRRFPKEAIGYAID